MLTDSIMESGAHPRLRVLIEVPLDQRRVHAGARPDLPRAELVVAAPREEPARGVEERGARARVA